MGFSEELKQLSRHAHIVCWVIVSMLFGVCFVYAGEFPIIGATYQLDRARYPKKVAVCVSEESMAKYIKAQEASDEAIMSEMLFDIKKNEDIEKMKKADGCTLISSYSQAKILKKGIYAHSAEFFAFPFLPMWGYYSYFGGQVK